MKKEEIGRLAVLNQICLTERERENVLAFFAARACEAEALSTIDTAGVAMTVHVMPVEPLLREDEVEQSFTREQMQSGAPLTDAGYWCVPHVLE